MLVRELIEYLQKLPGETEVCYRDMNYGGVEREFDSYALEYDGHSTLLVSSLYWRDVAEDE